MPIKIPDTLPAFETLVNEGVRVMTETVTEIWIALDRDRLPVKIRFTDKKGDVYEQLITEMGTDVIPPA